MNSRQWQTIKNKWFCLNNGIAYNGTGKVYEQKQTLLYTSEQDCDLTSCKVFILLDYSGSGPTGTDFLWEKTSVEL